MVEMQVAKNVKGKDLALILSQKTGMTSNQANRRISDAFFDMKLEIGDKTISISKAKFFKKALNPDHNSVEKFTVHNIANKSDSTAQFMGIENVVMQYLDAGDRVSILEVKDKIGFGNHAATYLKTEFGKMNVFATGKVVKISALETNGGEKHDCILLLDAKQHPQELIDKLKGMLNEGGILVVNHYNGNRMEGTVHKKIDGFVTDFTGDIYSEK